MPKTASYLKILTLICLCAFFVPIAVFAQTSTPTPNAPREVIHVIDILDPVEQDGPGGIPQLTVEVIFTVLNAKKEILLDASPVPDSPNSISISSGTFQAAVQKLEQPAWTVILLVDTSRTMGTVQGQATLKEFRSAITSSLSPGGNQAMKISVVKFDQFPNTVLGFTSVQEDYSKAVNGLRATQTGPTLSCLNDAAFNAVTQLGPLPGRRAVVILTASQDNCGKTTPTQVTQLADQNRIQIYAVGVQGYPITQKDLDDLTVNTGGIGVLPSQSTLGFAVSNISGILNNQFSAKATLCPPQQGPLTGQLNLTLSNGSQRTSDFFSFVSPRPYTCPPDIKIKGVVQPKNYGFDFNLDFISRDAIDKLEVKIDNKLTGLNVLTQTLPTEKFGEQNEFTAGLEEGKVYILTLTALSTTGVPLSQDQQEFTFVPEEVNIESKVLEVPTLDKPIWTLEVTPAAPEGVVKFQLILTAKEDQSGTPVTDPVTIPVGEPVTLPASDDLPEGQYVIIVQALDADDRVIASAASAVTWKPFTWFDRLMKIVNNPIGITLMAVICCGALFGLVGVVWVVMPKPSSQPKQVDLVVPEKRQRAAPLADSGFFEPAPPPMAAPPRAEPVSQRVERAAPAPPPVAVSDLPKAFLGGYAPPGVMPQIQITRVPLTIGRRVGNDVVLNVDNSMGVSGQHARITFTNGRFFVIDEGSTYGTSLNGQTIPKGLPTPIEDGAVLGFGPKVKLQFRLDRGA